jgi:hypothetical protein
MKGEAVGLIGLLVALIVSAVRGRDDDDPEDAPFVCPGCHAVGAEECAPGCIDAEIEAERRHAIEHGEYGDYPNDDDDPEDEISCLGCDRIRCTCTHAEALDEQENRA